MGGPTRERSLVQERAGGWYLHHHHTHKAWPSAGCSPGFGATSWPARGVVVTFVHLTRPAWRCLSPCQQALCPGLPSGTLAAPFSWTRRMHIPLCPSCHGGRPDNAYSVFNITLAGDTVHTHISLSIMPSDDVHNFFIHHPL